MESSDALCLVFQMLDLRNLVLAGAVCRRWRKLARTDPLVGACAVNLCDFPALRCCDYDAFLATWGRRVCSLRFCDDNANSCYTNDAFRWELASQNLPNLRALSVIVSSDCAYVPLPPECRWLAILGKRCPRLRSVRILVADHNDVAVEDLAPFLDAAAHKLDELVLAKFDSLLDDKDGVHEQACDSVQRARKTGRVVSTTENFRLFEYPGRCITTILKATAFTMTTNEGEYCRELAEWLKECFVTYSIHEEWH